jgi:hypothetical protein
MSKLVASLAAIALLSLATPFVPGTGLAGAQDKKEEKKQVKKKDAKKDAKASDKVAETPKKKKSGGC